MNQKPLSFIIEKDGKLELNKEVIDTIKKSVNPRFLLFYGTTRLGKSTTLNQIIGGNQETCSFKNKKPFNSRDTSESVTKGCNIFGPIKISEILKKHKGLESKKIKDDFDVFFCDTEGIASLDGMQKRTIPGILTLLQICTISVFMISKNCNSNNLKEICSQIQLSKIFKKKNLITPKVTIYISQILFGDKDDESDDSENEEDENDEDRLRLKYKKSAESQKQRIYEEVKKKYPSLGLDINDFMVIGGPYKNEKDPNPEDIDVKLYWDSIKEIIKCFLDNKGKKLEAIEITKYIELLFEAFNEIESFSEDFNLENYLKDYLEKSFDTYTIKKFKEIVQKIKAEIKTNFITYINILNNDEKAKESLNECFDKDYIDLYKKLIPKKVKNFIELSIEQYRKYIKEQIDKEFKSICEEILSDNNLNALINDVIININNAQFKEDIDMNSVNNTDKFWNDMYEKNKIILNYFKERKANILDNLKGNFVSKIKNIFRNLLSKKEFWTTYLKDKLILIQKEVSQLYQKMFSKCNYQEDMEKNIKKNDALFNDIFPGYKEKYFKNISQQRLNQVIEEMKKICQEEYNKIIQNILPNYTNIKKDITSVIKDKINFYLLKIFNKVEFREKIDRNLGTKNEFLKAIPSDIKQNSQMKKEEIDKIIDNEIDKGIQIFNEKRNNVPSFNEVLGKILTESTKLVDAKIKEIITKFHYLEEKIIFNTDTIFSFLTNNPEIYKNSYSKVNEININIRELCNLKEDEYDALVKKTKPEWGKIKKEKKILINKICQEYIQKIFKNVYFQDNVKNINEEELKRIIKNTPDLYKGVESYKNEEINTEIDAIIQRTLERIFAQKNSLKDWNSVKTQLFQQAQIEMINKSKQNLGSTDLNQVTNVLMNHIENLPYFFDECRTEERKNEIRAKIRERAEIIAKDYIKEKKLKEEMERANREERQKLMKQLEENEKRRIQSEKELRQEREILEQERKKREQAERERQESERQRQAAEARRQQIEDEINRQRAIAMQNQSQANNLGNDIERLAIRAMNGEFGNGQERRNRLGNLYAAVQNRINEKLGLSKRH